MLWKVFKFLYSPPSLLHILHRCERRENRVLWQQSPDGLSIRSWQVAASVAGGAANGSATNTSTGTGTAAGNAGSNSTNSGLATETVVQEFDVSEDKY